MGRVEDTRVGVLARHERQARHGDLVRTGVAGETGWCALAQCPFLFYKGCRLPGKDGRMQERKGGSWEGWKLSESRIFADSADGRGLWVFGVSAVFVRRVGLEC